MVLRINKKMSLGMKSLRLMMEKRLNLSTSLSRTNNLRTPINASDLFKMKAYILVLVLATATAIPTSVPTLTIQAAAERLSYRVLLNTVEEMITDLKATFSDSDNLQHITAIDIHLQTKYSPHSTYHQIRLDRYDLTV
ncbi:uncharacterized protein BDR25DRAFT_348163 [Lindgomyces ingoldianus]|uniref:Uncharacterized protein n=1 Tax=Lindgomyces ingoldianus TaxID=673940 RepID=A0ACB6RH98_9PLEO|nr:uncharacterized protein BDR25DRAFT_348163 [Lindgomyces ingoldianus]KAF2477846.1 hypothetical protein BDR25DRAFT_348163 [Lindgomyces ingoldianus]